MLPTSCKKIFKNSNELKKNLYLIKSKNINYLVGCMYNVELIHVLNPVQT